MALNAPLDVFLSRKLGVPGNEELAFGAVAAEDGRFLDNDIVHAANISAEQIEQITAKTRKLLEERARLYRHGWPALAIKDKTVILVDDGIATGASISAARCPIQALFWLEWGSDQRTRKNSIILSSAKDHCI